MGVAPRFSSEYRYQSFAHVEIAFDAANAQQTPQTNLAHIAVLLFDASAGGVYDHERWVSPATAAWRKYRLFPDGFAKQQAFAIKATGPMLHGLTS
jgi:hypothetical protein